MSLQLKRQNLVKKVEVQPDQVTIYLEQVRRGQEQEPWDVEDFPMVDGCTFPLGCLHS